MLNDAKMNVAESISEAEVENRPEKDSHNSVNSSFEGDELFLSREVSSWIHGS